MSSDALMEQLGRIDSLDQKAGIILAAGGIVGGLAEHALGPVASELLDAGSRFTKEQLGGIREFLRLGAEISYRRAEEISAEVASRGLIRPCARKAELGTSRDGG